MTYHLKFKLLQLLKYLLNIKHSYIIHTPLIQNNKRYFIHSNKNKSY